MLQKVKKLSPWRKLSLVTWGAPNDPTVYGAYQFDVTEAQKYLKAYNQKHHCKVTLTHYVAKVLGLTIAQFPNINGLIKWNRIYRRDTVDIFLQVAVDNPDKHHSEHLSGAKISRIDQKSLKDISIELSSQALSIRQDKDPQFQKTFSIAQSLPLWLLKPLVRIHEFLVYNLQIKAPSLGLVPDPFGSAMLTSVGPLDVPAGFAPIVPPSRCPFLICLGRIEDKPWVIDGQLQVRPVADFTCTFDHRFMDGLVASKMFKGFMEALYHPQDHLGPV